MDDENNSFEITYQVIYKYKSNNYTGDEVISGYFYLLDRDLCGGENKFFGTGFFSTWIENTMILRRMTKFKVMFHYINWRHHDIEEDDKV